MENHKVDVYTACTITTCGRSIGGCCKGNCGIESAGRYSDNSHSVIHFDSAVDIGIAVLGEPCNVGLEYGVYCRRDEEDSSFVGYFSIVKSRFSGLNSRSRTSRKSTSHDLRSICASRYLRKTISVYFGYDIYSLVFSEKRTERHAYGLIVVHYIYCEASATIDSDGERLPNARSGTGNEAAVAVIVSKSVQFELEYVSGLCTDPVDTLVSGIKDSGKRFPLVNFIEKRDEF